MPSDWIYAATAAETICHKITSLIGGVYYNVIYYKLLIYFVIFYNIILYTSYKSDEITRNDLLKLQSQSPSVVCVPFSVIVFLP